MVPPELANTTLPARAATAPWQTLSVPRMFTSASKAGRFTDTRTSACAARWNTTSGFRCTMRSVIAGERTSSRWKENFLLPCARASERFASDPAERSSTTSTLHPSASRRSVSVEPMKPAPPVTSAFTRPDLRSSPGVQGHFDRTNLVGDLGVVTDRATPEHHRPQHHGAFADGRVSAEHGSLDPGPRPDPGALADQHRSYERRIRCDARTRLDPHAARTLDGTGRGRETGLALEHVDLRLEVLLRSADVEPVGVGAHRKQPAGTFEHPGERLAFDRHPESRGNAREH